MAACLNLLQGYGCAVNYSVAPPVAPVAPEVDPEAPSIEPLGAGVAGVPAPGAVVGSAGVAAGGTADSAGGAVSSSLEHAANMVTDAAMAMTARYVRVLFMDFLNWSRVAIYGVTESDATNGSVASV